jgi:hypothetical protein
MINQPSHRAATPRRRPPMEAAALDAFLLDDEFDDVLDRQIASLREAPADFRNF